MAPQAVGGPSLFLTPSEHNVADGAFFASVAPSMVLALDMPMLLGKRPEPAWGGRPQRCLPVVVGITLWGKSMAPRHTVIIRGGSPRAPASCLRSSIVVVRRLAATSEAKEYQRRPNEPADEEVVHRLSPARMTMNRSRLCGQPRPPRTGLEAAYSAPNEKSINCQIQCKIQPATAAWRSQFSRSYGLAKTMTH